jgi:hypothetical protein
VAKRSKEQSGSKRVKARHEEVKWKSGAAPVRPGAEIWCLPTWGGGKAVGDGMPQWRPRSERALMSRPRPI